MVKEKSQYNSLAEWRKVNPNGYAKAKREGWLDEICNIFGWEKPQTKPNGYWTKERCITEAKKFKTRTGWMRDSSSSYSSARKNGWVDDASRHMKNIRVIKPNGYWDNKKHCIVEAKKYNTISEWQMSSSGSVNSARKRGWFDECTKHMKRTRKPAGYWNVKENVLVEAKKYNTISEWQMSSSASVNSARKHGWFDECTKHMAVCKKPSNYWSKEKCLAEAKKFKTKKKWEYLSPTSYKKANIKGWMIDCDKHMKRTRKPAGYWNVKENVLVEAKKHEKIRYWQMSSSGSVNSARKHGWFDECTKHMIDKIKWTKKSCIKEAKKYKYRSDFQNKSGSCYQATRRNGWLDECTKHMIKKI